jgi:hypothetical protein
MVSRNKSAQSDVFSIVLFNGRPFIPFINKPAGEDILPYLQQKADGRTSYEQGLEGVDVILTQNNVNQKLPVMIIFLSDGGDCGSSYRQKMQTLLLKHASKRYKAILMVFNSA